MLAGPAHVPSSRRSRTRTRLPLLATAVVLAALAAIAPACGGGRADDRAIPRATPTTVAPTRVPGPPPAPTATPAPTVPATPTPAVLPEGWDLAVGPAAEAGPTRRDPIGGQLPDPAQGTRWHYEGVLGRLRPNERVVARVAPPVPTRPGISPLTGLPGRHLDERAMIVKIDNVSAARPQVAINQADIVVEELVEGGYTRLAAVFQSRHPTVIGPIRSARSTDIGIASSYHTPIFANSGANSIFAGLVARSDLIDRGNIVFGGYWRDAHRRAPHNLFTSSAELLGSVRSSGKPPAPQFAYRDEGERPPDSAPRAHEIRLVFQAGRSPEPVRYRWNPKVGGWLRSQAGSPHVDASGERVAPENVVVWFTDYVDTGLTDKWGEDLYEGVSVGTGDALVFTKGRVVRARWTRSTLRSVATFTDVTGNHVELTPGRTWIAMVPPGGATWN